MKNDMVKNLAIVRLLSGIGLTIGFISFFISLFVNGFNGENLFLLVSLSIMAASMMIFGFFHFLFLMETANLSRRME
ncbi:hypothetical protein ACE38V_11810 [Cytobacillus sp. Hz8]|uniref:hypothetical protein n=1 Tax=Cytobacillus sp. Hz8 TaxID=3347168 RepID=UPI0035D70392